MKIICIIPAYNEEATIGDVIREVSPHVSEIIVIDDGSTDDTATVAKAKGAYVVSNIINRGLGVTIRRGYREALHQGADIIVQIDADGQYTAEDIPKLIAPILENKADMVLASRFKGGIEKMPLGKKIGNKIGSWVTRRVSGVSVSDAQTGFRALRKELALEIKPHNQYTYVQEMIIRSAKEGWRIAEIPSYFKKRESGKSRLISGLFSYARRALLIVTSSIRDYHPISFFGFIGVLLGLLGFCLGLTLVARYLELGRIDKTPSIVLAALLIITGLQLVFFGFMAHMIRELRFEILEEFREIERAWLTSKDQPIRPNPLKGRYRNKDM